MGNGGDSGGSIVETTESADPDELKQAKERKKRKERKARWRERKRERERAAVDESMEEKEDEDDPSSSDSYAQQVSLPSRLVGAGRLRREYARQLAAVHQNDGWVSKGSYWELMELIDEDKEVLESRGKDWKTAYSKLPLVSVRVVVSDDDLSSAESDYSEDDVLVDE